MSRSGVSGVRRALLAALAFGLVLAGCAATTPGGRTGDPSILPSDASPSGDGPGQPDPSASGGAASPGAPHTGGAGPTRGPGSSPGPGPGEQSYADGGAVGQMARVYLRSSPARRLLVEVDYVSGRAPSNTTLEHLAGILRREARKPDGVLVQRGEELPARRTRYSLEDVARIEREHRDARSSGSTATMYLLYLNGELEEEPDALGVAYTASSAVVFIDRVRSAATALVQPGSIERAVAVHEAGHLLALINIGYQSRHDHEDPEHRHHSRHRDSVMYWAVEDISVTSILGGGPPSDFNQFDRDDLAQLRGD